MSELFAIETAPYWAFCWGSGQALARFVLDHPEHVRERVVADFGSGSGVCAIAAALSGARAVFAVDSDPFALRAITENARLNHVHVETVATMPAAFDVLLASDVLYEVGNRELLERHASEGRTVIVSDPQRAHHPRLCEPACAYDVETVPNVDAPSRHAVIYLLKS